MNTIMQCGCRGFKSRRDYFLWLCPLKIRVFVFVLRGDLHLNRDYWLYQAPGECVASAWFRLCGLEHEFSLCHYYRIPILFVTK